jgi:hypothetical protein
VEVRIDDGHWLPASIDEGEDAEFAWKTFAGHVQPTQDDPWIACKHTFWESNGQVTRRVRVV